MRLPRKVNYCILLALVFITIVFRFPIGVDHEMGSDTTFVHTMANSIAQDGYAKWILHPSSYFGLYALSYPSAAPFVLSSVFLVSDITIEGAVFLFGQILAIVGVISAYIMAKLIRDDDIFAHSIALLFTLAPFYIKDTTWVASSRGFVVALLPFFLLLLIKHMKTKDLRYLILSLAVFLVLGSMHRMGLLVILIFIAYILALPLHLVTQRLRFSLIRFEKPMRFALVFLALIAFLSIFYIQFQFPGISGSNVVEQYERGAILSGRSFPALLINMGVSFVGRVGLLLPLAPIGLIAYVWKRPKESVDKFLLLTIFIFLPLLSLRDYIIEFVIPIFALLVVTGAIGLTMTLKKRKQLSAVFLAGLLVASAVFSWQTKDRWRDFYITDQPVPEAVYDAALYIRYRGWGTVATNAGLTGGRLAAISGLPNLPMGGASTHFLSPQQLMWDFVDGESLEVRLVNLTSVSFNTDEIYVPVHVPNAELHWELIFGYRNPTESRSLMNYYRVHFVASDNSILSYYTSYGFLRISCLLGTDGLPPGSPNRVCVSAENVLPNTMYVVFTNSAVTLWLARGGPPDK
jgi:hypothetical protein